MSGATLAGSNFSFFLVFESVSHPNDQVSALTRRFIVTNFGCSSLQLVHFTLMRFIFSAIITGQNQSLAHSEEVFELIRNGLKIGDILKFSLDRKT